MLLTCHRTAPRSATYTAVPGVGDSHMPFRTDLIVIFLTFNLRVIHM